MSAAARPWGGAGQMLTRAERSVVFTVLVKVTWTVVSGSGI